MKKFLLKFSIFKEIKRYKDNVKKQIINSKENSFRKSKIKNSDFKFYFKSSKRN